MSSLLSKTERACKIYNLRQENKDLELCVVKNPNEIEDLYNTYEGEKEFLYIPPKNEIEETINNKNSIYLGLRFKKQLIGITKLSLLELPSSFFCPPKSEPVGDYYGVSGLLVKNGSRGLKIAKRMVKCATIIAKYNGGVGIYADFDYRNIDSMRVVSKLYNFIGFADGTHGADGEQTIYTTFYKPLTYNLNRINDINISSNFNCKSVAKELENFMKENGTYTVTKVNYGGENRYNLLYCLDNVIPFNKFEIRNLDNRDENTF